MMMMTMTMLVMTFCPYWLISSFSLYPRVTTTWLFISILLSNDILQLRHSLNVINEKNFLV